MRESLDRQEAARLGLLPRGGRVRAAELTEARRRFDAALRSAANNITEPGEVETIAALTQDRDAYYRQVDGFLAAMGTAPSRNTEGIRGIGLGWSPWATRLRDDCGRLLQINQQAMVAKAEAATQVAYRWFFAPRSGSRPRWWPPGSSSRCSSPIASSGRSASCGPRPPESPAGTSTPRPRSPRRMKSGRLAEDFNRMAERIRELRRSDLGKLLIAQQTTEAAIDSLYDPVIVTDAQGAVTRLNPAAEEVFGPAPHTPGDRLRRSPAGNQARGGGGGGAALAAPGGRRGHHLCPPLAVDGAERAFRLRTTPMHDGEGAAAGGGESPGGCDAPARGGSDEVRVHRDRVAWSPDALTSVQMNILLLLEESGIAVRRPARPGSSPVAESAPAWSG